MSYTPSPQTAQRIFQEALTLPLRAVRATVLPSLLLTTLVFVSLHNANNQIALATWAAAIGVSKLNCLRQAKRWLKRQFTTESAQTLIREMRFFYGLDGAAWASLIWITLDTCSPIENALAITAVAGTTISRMTQLSPMLSAYFSFVACGSVIWLPKIFLANDGAYHALGIASLFYILCVISFARGSARTARQSIELRFQNEDLVLQLQTEKALADQAQHKAEEANQAKSKFLAAASHDLRQPAHAQGLILEVMARTTLNEQQRELLDNAREVANSSAQMLDTLLDFSRLEAGVIRPKIEDFSTQRLLHKIEREFGPLSDAKGIFYRSRETALVARSDPALVELILRNLVSNAIRYTERGGLLVTCRRRGEHIEMAVWDTGIGIAPEQQQAVFREFQQLGNPERDRRKGLGLGLAIAEGLARQLGHPLTLSSTPGRGSVFRLKLPLVGRHDESKRPCGIRRSGLDPESRGTSQDSGLRRNDEAILCFQHGIRRGTISPSTPIIETNEFATSDAGWRLRNAHVLVIDDDESVRTGMRHLLTDWGCRCFVAESFDEALHLAAQYRPQAIVSDFRLRGPHTGADIIAALRDALGAPLPALLITGDTAPARLLEAHASGIPLLHKPVPPHDLRRALLGLLSTDSSTPPAAPASNA